MSLASESTQYQNPDVLLGCNLRVGGHYIVLVVGGPGIGACYRHLIGKYLEDVWP